MMWNREELKMRGKAAMKSNYGACVAVSLLMGIISAIFSGGSGSASGSGTATGTEGMVEGFSSMDPEMAMLVGAIASVALIAGIIGTLLKIFVENILKVGGYSFFIKNQAGMHPPVDSILDGFRSGQYVNIMVTMFLKELFIGLWSLLFIIPGIIKSYEYMMVPYILAENPGMDRKAAFKISKRMMDGQKMEAFILDLSFFGWILLSLFTCGILAVLYVNPYIEATKAEMYAFNKMKGFEEGFIR